MSALEGKGFNFATIQTFFEGVEMNNADRLSEIQQRNGMAIPFGHDLAEERYPSAMTDYAPTEALRAQRHPPNCRECRSKKAARSGPAG